MLTQIVRLQQNVRTNNTGSRAEPRRPTRVWERGLSLFTAFFLNYEILGVLWSKFLLKNTVLIYCKKCVAVPKDVCPTCFPLLRHWGENTI